MTDRISVLKRAFIGRNNDVSGRPQGNRSVAPGRYSTLSPSAFKYQQLLAEARREQASSLLK